MPSGQKKGIVLMPLGCGEGTGFFLSRVACHMKGKNNSQTSHERPFGFPTSHKWQSHEWRVGNQNWPWVTSLGIIPVTSPQPRGTIIPIVSENLQFKVKRKALPMPVGQNDRHSQWFLLKRKALPMPSGQNEGTANFPYQIVFTWNIGMRNTFKTIVQRQHQVLEEK